MECWKPVSQDFSLLLLIQSRIKRELSWGVFFLIPCSFPALNWLLFNDCYIPSSRPFLHSITLFVFISAAGEVFFCVPLLKAIHYVEIKRAFLAREPCSGIHCIPPKIGFIAIGFIVTLLRHAYSFELWDFVNRSTVL